MLDVNDAKLISDSAHVGQDEGQRMMEESEEAGGVDKRKSVHA